MENPFVVLGVRQDATGEEIRAAYHRGVKRCHPDAVQDESRRKEAQEALVRLNLAYAEAMRLVSSRQTGSVVIPDAAQVAGKLYEQGLYDGALRVLNKALTRDAAWYHLQGSILLKKNEAEAAHSCFRTAVRMDPNNALYRQCALNAAVRMRKQKTLRGRMACWARGLVK